MADERINLSSINPAAAKASAAAASAPSGAAEEAYQLLRRLAAVGYQLRAATVAGDRYLTQDNDADRDTGGWLISCAVALAEEITVEIDGLAKSWKQRPGDTAVAAGLHKLRIRAHQLHAAAKAADHFLDEDNSDDHTTGSWLVACALGLADKIAGETEDLASLIKRAGAEPAAAAPVADVTLPRRAAAAPRPAAVQ